MKTVQKLSLLTMALLVASCNEKVSPELQSSAATTPDATIAVPPSEFYFTIENSSDTLLNYKLHKTGAGNLTKSCEVKNTTGLSSDVFRGDPATNDITCYFDAEELSLYHAGLSFKIKTSKNTCDFVGYIPYGYYNRIPGDSTSTFYQATCANATTNSTHLALAATALGVDIRDFTGSTIGCKEWVIDDSIIPQGTRKKFTPATDADLCRFNYKDGGKEQCDVGVITVNELVVIYTPANGTTPEVRKEEIVPREITCGGKIPNCVQGPTKIQGEDSSRILEVTQTALNKDFELEYKYEGLNDSTASVIQYSNFRKNLANRNIDFVSSFGLPAGYRSIWSDPFSGKVFDPRLVDHYAANLMLNGSTQLVDAATLASEAVKNETWFAMPLAAEPFIGLEERVNPFYSFYCFDTAYDIKARIRMVVRDFDRVFPTNADQEFISDLFRGSSARQDIPGGVELPGELDSPILFNDRADWDDRIPMERSAGAFDPNATIWRPTPTLALPMGWFNPAYFPNFDHSVD